MKLKKLLIALLVAVSLCSCHSESIGKKCFNYIVEQDNLTYFYYTITELDAYNTNNYKHFYKIELWSDDGTCYYLAGYRKDGKIDYECLVDEGVKVYNKGVS